MIYPSFKQRLCLSQVSTDAAANFSLLIRFN